MPETPMPAMAPEDLRHVLRLGTREDHERLDAQLGACVLSTRAGLTRFLQAHAIGLQAVAPLATRFLQDELGLAMPDVQAMVAQDLADLGCTAPLPALPALPDEGAAGAGADAGAGAYAGAAYVLIGSRLGTAVLRSHGYWSPGTPGFSRYMEDNSLRALWQPLVKALRDLPQARHEAALTTARASFAAFEQGLHLAQTMPLPDHEGALPS
jgi:heme oxygenase (biliverdin-IX-beta and delta-forming)